MDYKNIIVPFINKDIIKKRADLFRQKYWDESIPVDIEKIIDVKLRINVIPLLGLEKICNTDAYISPDWQSIYIDEEKFLDERNMNRLRFSLAHEIGHFVLHKNIYSKFSIDNLEDFYKFYEEIPREQYGKIETQANIFAGYLLIPRDKLSIQYKKMIKEFITMNKIDINKVDIRLLNSYISRPISKFFGVSQESIEIALNDLNN